MKECLGVDWPYFLIMAGSALVGGPLLLTAIALVMKFVIKRGEDKKDE